MVGDGGIFGAGKKVMNGRMKRHNFAREEKKDICFFGAQK